MFPPKYLHKFILTGLDFKPRSKETGLFVTAPALIPST